MNYDKNSEKLELEFKVSKIKTIKRIKKIWNSKVVDLKSVIINFNEKHKDYIIIEIELEEKNTEEEFKLNLRATSKTLFRQILNIKDFKGAKLNYIIKADSESEKSSEILFVIPDKYPVLKGCNENLINENSRKCFQENITKYIKRNIDLSLLEKTGLKLGKYKIQVYFTIDKTREIIDLIPESKNINERLELEINKIFKSIKIIKPAYNNGEFISLKLLAPIFFEIR